MNGTDELLTLAGRHLLRTYKQPPLVLARGQGCRVWDTDGRSYLDLFAGIAVNVLGHAHPRLARALAEQAGTALHVSNYFYNDKGIRLAGALGAGSGLERVFLCNSGTEALEGALKLARRHHYNRGDGARTHAVATHGSFHGRSLGAVALTGQPKYWEGFGPRLGEVSHVPYGDLAALQRRVNDRTAAVFVEPIQGEGGVVPAPAGYLAGLRALCDASGALLVVDEVQTGVGRTGRFLACQHDKVLPDVVTLAKGLAGGVPIGAVLAREALADALPPGSHGSTFGGNPFAAAAALCVLDVLDTEALLPHAERMGRHLAEALAGLVARHPGVAVEARGRGLLQGLVLAPEVDTRALLGALRERGVLLSQAGDRVLRFAPALVITAAELDEGLAAVDAALRDPPRDAAPEQR